METKEKVEAPLKCSKCNFTHRIAKVMDVHKKIHTDTIKFGCPFCKFDTKKSYCVVNHINTFHAKFKEVRHCPYCDFKTPAMPMRPMNEHIERYHGNILRTCSFCDYSCTEKQLIMEHLNVQHMGEKDYQCWDCIYKTDDLAKFNEHFRAFHSLQLFRCRFCGFYTSRNCNLTNHELTPHMVYKCLAQSCDYFTTWATDMDKHKGSKHSGKRVRVKKKLMVMDLETLQPIVKPNKSVRTVQI